MVKQKKQKKVGTGHNPVPFTRAHSDRVRLNKKEQRRNARREAKEGE